MRKLRRSTVICLLIILLMPSEVFAARDIPCAVRVGIRDVEFFPHRIEYYSAAKSDEYSPALSHMLCALSYSAYRQSNIRRSYFSMGFTNFKCFNYYANYRDEDYSYDSSAYTIGKKTLNDGSDLILITIRGTYGSSENSNLPEEERENEIESPIGQDWMSNLNTGWKADASGYHSGFNTAAEEVLASLTDFFGSLPKSNTKYVLTGHSRGAAVANLLSVKLMEEGISPESLYDYNFACPNNVFSDDEENPIDVSGYDNIFNISSCSDIIAHLPGLLSDTLEYFNLDDIALSVSSGLSKLNKGWDKFGRTFYYCADWNDEEMLGLDFSFESHTPKNYLEQLKKEEDISCLKSWEEIREAVLSNTSLEGLIRFNTDYLPG